MVGVQYSLIDNVMFYPIEIQKLIDILSINKKYLFSNKFMRQEFIDSLVAMDVISSYSAVDPTNVLSGGISSTLDTYKYRQSDVDAFLSSMYRDFMLDIVEMSGCGTLSSIAMYSQVSSTEYPYSSSNDSKYAAMKKLNNVSPFFNVS